MKNLTRPIWIFTCMALLLCALPGCKSGRALLRGEKNNPPPATAALPSNASTQEIIAVVNKNMGKFQSLSTTNASLAGDGIFSLKGEIAFQRPEMFRLRGSHAVSGAELDVGRNSELSWLWVAKSDPKSIYYVRNDQYANSRFATDLPIDPSWMADAMGFGSLDPSLNYEGPYQTDESHLELRVKDQGANGNSRTRVFVINRVRGVPAALRIYDKFDTLAVDSRVTSYYTGNDGITIPQTVEIRCPKENDGKGLNIHINLGTPTLNQLDPENKHLWTMPQFPGYSPQNMGLAAK